MTPPHLPSGSKTGEAVRNQFERLYGSQSDEARLPSREVAVRPRRAPHIPERSQPAGGKCRSSQRFPIRPPVSQIG